MDLAQKKEKMIAACKARYQNKMMRAYPLDRRVNIAIGVEQGLDEMKDFLIQHMAECDAVVAAIESIKDENFIEDFRTDSDENMAKYVATKVKGLGNDDLKLAVASAIQAVK